MNQIVKEQVNDEPLSIMSITCTTIDEIATCTQELLDRTMKFQQQVQLASHNAYIENDKTTLDASDIQELVESITSLVVELDGC